MSTRTPDVSGIVQTATENPRWAVVSALKYGFGLVITVWMLFPIYWMVVTSLKPREVTMNWPPKFLFFDPTLSNYTDLFASDNFGLFLANSFIVATAAVLISVVIGVPAAYALSRMDVPGGHHISFWILSTRMVPPLSILVPLFVFFTAVGLTKTLAGLTIAHFLITLPMIIWIVKGFIDQLPESLEESAMVDGCNRIQAFREVVVPLVMPGIAAAAFISYIFSWNNFLLALVLTSGNSKTAPLQIQAAMGYLSIDWAELGAAATVTVLPVVVISLLIRDYLVEGLTMGAVKE
jgi:multiple sugar transport system permease protein